MEEKWHGKSLNKIDTLSHCCVAGGTSACDTNLQGFIYIRAILTIAQGEMGHFSGQHYSPLGIFPNGWFIERRQNGITAGFFTPS